MLFISCDGFETNMGFADDVLSTAPHLKQLTSMLTNLHAAAKPYGLELYPDKTRVTIVSR